MNWKDLTYTKIHTAGREYPENTVIPDGWEWVDYRLAREGEDALAVDGYILHGRSSVPVLILRRKKVRKIVLTEVRRGHAEEGEYYTCDKWGISTICGPWRPCVAPPVHSADITAYRREDIEE